MIAFCCYIFCLFTLTYQICTAKIQYRKFETKELHGHSLNFHIHVVPVSVLYIPRNQSALYCILLQENMWTNFWEYI
jgi:hypothetical protein